MPRLGGQTIKAVSLLDQNILRLLDFPPGHFDVAHLAFVGRLRREGDVVHRPDGGMGVDDDVQQERCRFHRLAVDNEVFARVDKLILIAVEPVHSHSL